MSGFFNKIFPSKKFHEYIFDFIIIVISISLTIYLDNKAKEKNDHNQEISLLENIHANMVSDTIGINDIVGWTQEVQTANDYLLSGDTSDIGLDSIAYYFFIILQYNPFSQTISGYEEMKQAGLSSLVENKELLTEIINHFSIYSVHINEVNTIDKDYIIDDLLPFINNEFKGYADANTNAEIWRAGLNNLMNDFRYRNILQSNYNLKYRALLFYEGYKKDIISIIHKIEVELNTLQSI